MRNEKLVLRRLATVYSLWDLREAAAIACSVGYEHIWEQNNQFYCRDEYGRLSCITADDVIPMRMN